jgi:hypothetical protein
MGGSRSLRYTGEAWFSGNMLVEGFHKLQIPKAAGTSEIC